MANRGVGTILKPSGGYTILEVLLFIAISAFIFIYAMTAIGGRQQQVQFSQGAREFEAKLSDVINDVTTGYYPTKANINCEVPGTGRPVISDSTGVELGTNGDCLFVGKVIHFAPSYAANSESTIHVYNLAGRRFASGNTLIKSIDDAQPVAVAAADSGSPFADSVEEYTLSNGIKITKVYKPVPTNEKNEKYELLGILSNFEGSTLGSAANVQSILLGGINSSVDLSTKNIAVNVINLMTEDSAELSGYINTDTGRDGIIVCLADGNGRRAYISLGSNSDVAPILNFDEELPAECPA